LTMMHHTRHAWSGTVVGSLFLIAALAAAWVGWMRPSPRAVTLVPAMVASNLAIASLFLFDGALTILPAFAAVNTLSFAVAMGRRWRVLAVCCGLTAVLFPALAAGS